MPERPAAVLLLNPHAAGAREAGAPSVRATLASRYALVDVQAPATADAFAAAARSACAAGIAALFVAGGDGTARLAAAALADSQTALGVLPAGTANDLARALGLPRTPARAAASLATARPRAVDLLDADGATITTVGGLGLVSASARRAAAMRAGGAATRALARATGSGIYRLAATLALLSPEARVRRYVVSHLSAAGVRHDDEVVAHGAFVANQRFTGGGLAVPGAGADDDGVFELCFVLPASRPRLVARFARLAAGLPVPSAALRLIACREAHVVCSAPDGLLGDGEALGTGRLFHLRARHRALQVLC